MDVSHYKKIFEPYRLRKNVVLRNRVIFPNAPHAYPQGPETWPADPTIAEMSEFLLSGASIVCLGHFGKLGGGAIGSRKADPESDRSHISIFDYDNPATSNYLSQESAIAHMHGSKLLVKLAPSWPDGYTYGGGDARSLCPPPPGAKSGWVTKEPTRRKKTNQPNSFVKTGSFTMGGMTLEQQKARIAPKEVIQSVIDEIVDTAVMYKSWGWDGMSFRCDRFIDADTNLREDEYGGEIENRGRFLYELFAQVKEACGEDFIITAAMGCRQEHGYDYLLNHGYTLDEAVRFVLAGKDVIDIVEWREPTSIGHQCSGYDSLPGVHESVDAAKALRDAGFEGTIAVNGGFHDPDEWEQILNDGVVDLISAGRPFRADPDLLRKLRTQGEAAPTPCLRCNRCHGTESGPWLAVCSVNPKDGLVDKLPYITRPPQRSKKVAVIGGGPIGMRAAIFAAERGHSVTLFEKTDFLGGKLRYASLYQMKWPFERYRKWLVDELRRLGVEVKLNCNPDPEDITAAGFEAVIACTGSVGVKPEVEGADDESVLICEDIYTRRADAGQKVVIVGGSDVATDTALHLAQLGKDVTVLTRAGRLMRKEVRPHGPHLAAFITYPGKEYGTFGTAWAKYDNLKPVYKATTTKVTPNSVTYVKDGVETTIECDTVIVNGGYEPCIDDALKYGTCTTEFYLAGDVERDICVNLQQGNRSAFGKAYLL